MVDKSLAKAFRRKIGFDETLLEKIDTVNVESSLLMNSSRRTLFEYICNHPCNHLRAISRGTNFPPQNVGWHLKKLTKGGLITESSHGKKKIYSPLKHYIKKEECRILSLFSDEKLKRIFLYIKKNPKTTQKEMSEILNIYQQKLSNALLALERSGLVEYKKKGREKTYRVTGMMKILEDEFELRSEFFKKELVLAMEKDGLNPKIKRDDKNQLSIQLRIGGEKNIFLRVKKNPIKSLLKD